MDIEDKVFRKKILLYFVQIVGWVSFILLILSTIGWVKFLM